MARLYVTEYGKFGFDDNGGSIPLGREPAITTQVVTFTTSTASNEFAANTKLVRIISDTDCHLLFGSSPTATTNHQFLPANQEAWRMVTGGMKVAAVEASS